MKIHILGRSSYSYIISRNLRRAGHESHFFYEPDIHPRISVAWDIIELPDEEVEKMSCLDFEGTSPFTPAGREIIRQIGECDILHCTGLSAYWAILTGRPVVYQAFGGDLSRWPFKQDSPEDRARSLAMWKIIENVSGFLSLRHSKRNVSIVKKLGNGLAPDFVNFYPIDDEVFRPLSRARRELVRKELGCHHKTVAFLPSQLLFRPLPTLNASKGSDIFLQAISKLWHESGIKDLELWVVYRSAQRQEFQEMVRRAGLEQCVRWFNPCSKARLVELYNAADMIFDQIYPEIGNHGALTLEAMACGKPVFTHIDQAHRRAIGEPFIPVVNVQEPDEICEKVMELRKNPGLMKKIGNDALDFIKQYHHWKPATNNLINIYNTVLQSQQR